MNKAYLLIGGNLGDREANLESAKNAISHEIGRITECSSIYETAPWGNSNQANFLNQVLLVETIHAPSQLMKSLLLIEQKLGRIRSEMNEPRTIDIDILYYNNDIVHEESIIIPHPRIAIRKFVLIPLNEIAPVHIDPVHQKTIEQLLDECPDTLEVNKFLTNVHNKD
ncbi:MAG: 2-amino-4-hydroxy-6-hydroxymethyldihydropteridine diphosphokinase [Bacteroidota bacterium]